jgi:hypothetical protein
MYIRTACLFVAKHPVANVLDHVFVPQWSQSYDYKIGVLLLLL